MENTFHGISIKTYRNFDGLETPGAVIAPARKGGPA